MSLKTFQYLKDKLNISIITDVHEKEQKEATINIAKKHISIGKKVKIKFVKDRPGHDYRYAIDSTKIRNELGWKPVETFETGLRRTVEWYLANSSWWKPILTGEYRGQRLGGAD